VSDPVAKVFVSWGLWVADCPRDGCRGSEHLGHAPITGAVGGLTPTGFTCARCGLFCASQWPANAEDIWRILAQRPLEETRSWQLGEPIENLIVENIAHGLIAGEDVAAIGGIRLLDGRLTDQGLQLVAAPQGDLKMVEGRS